MSDPERQPLIANEEEPTRGWSAYREKVADVIESKRLHQTVIALVSRHPNPFSTSHDVRVQSKIAIDAACVLADLIYTFLSESCLPPEEGPPWLHILSRISLAITTLFLIEIPIALFAFGPKYSNPFGEHPHASLHLFDWTVIIVTFTLEFLLRGKERELVGLLVVLRLWRLVKLVGGPSLLIHRSFVIYFLLNSEHRNCCRRRRASGGNHHRALNH
jgi:hypothetical protein